MRIGWLLCGLLALGLAAPLQAADEFKNHPGYVDGSKLLMLTDEGPKVFSPVQQELVRIA